MTRILPASCLAATALFGAACSVNLHQEGVTAREEKRFEATNPVDLHLYTFDGSVEVRAWDRQEVVVEIEKRASDKEAVSKIQVLAERTGDRIQIETRSPSKSGVTVGFGAFTSPSARIIANVPLKTNVVVRSGDGAILVERVTGRLELRTSDGSIRTVETSGELIAESGDGNIQLEGISGRVEVHTEDGSLRIVGTPSVLRARSGDGAVVLRIGRGTSMTGDWMVTTGDGSIAAALPEDLNCEIEADPGSDGRARADITLSNTSGGTRSDRVLRGRLGEGGRALVLRTGDGTIRLTGH